MNDVVVTAPLEKASLPSGLSDLDVWPVLLPEPGECDPAEWPSDLDVWLWQCIDQSLEQVTLLSGLQTLMFGSGCDQCLEKATLPSGLLTLMFGSGWDQSLEEATLPSSL